MESRTTGLFTYLRLKVQVTLLRLLMRVLFFKQRSARREFTRKCTSLDIPSRDRDRSIAANLYLLPNVGLNPTSPLTVLINYHGGGFVLPDHGSDAFFCARMAQTAGIAVVDSDYRKSPEHPFPAAVNDAEDVLKWILGNPQRFDADRILLCGFSAGANLALVTSTSPTVKQELKNAIRGVIAFYPATDLSIPVENRYPPNSNFPRSTWLYRLARECYIPPSVDRRHPRLSPTYADVDDFPAHIMMLTCEGDELCSEAEALARKLKTASRSVVHTRLEDVGHGFDKACRPGSREERIQDEVYALVTSTIKDFACIS